MTIQTLNDIHADASYYQSANGNTTISGGGSVSVDTMNDLKTVVEIQQSTIDDLKHKIEELEDLVYGVIDDIKNTEVQAKADTRKRSLRTKKQQHDLEQAYRATKRTKRSVGRTAYGDRHI